MKHTSAFDGVHPFLTLVMPFESLEEEFPTSRHGRKFAAGEKK